MFSLASKLNGKRTRLNAKKSRGFTIVELLIVIVVIGILATLVIVTFTGIQRKARDSQRQTDINAAASHIEAFYAQNGYYPTYTDLTTTSVLSASFKGLDPEALKDPKGGALINGATPSATAYAYQATGAANCTATSVSDPTTNGGCDGYTITATLEGGGTYQKKSN